jgi:hypothetical protein
LILQGCLAQSTPVYLKGDQNRILIKLSQDTANFHNQQFSSRQWQLNKEKSGTNDPVGCFPVSTLTPFSIQMKPLMATENLVSDVLITRDFQFVNSQEDLAWETKAGAQ